MKDKTQKNIRLCCFIALAFCLVWAVSMVVNFTANLFGTNAALHPIDWTKNTFMKVVVVFCYVAGTIALITLCVMAVINILKGLRENIAFPKSNEKLMFWIALADFICLLGIWNLQVLWDDNLKLILTTDIFITPFSLLFFAFMYKVAADAVEENSLTV